MSTAEQFEFISSDGLTIACVKWGNRGNVRGVVQIAHGLGEHIRRYTELVDKLVQAEFVVYGNDHRGHGLTAKSSDSFGDFGPAGFAQVVEDMVSLRVIAKKEHPGKPYILLGHSMGSFAAQQFVLDHSHSIDGLALSGSGTLDGLLRVAQSISPGEDPMKLMNAAFEPARTPFDWLSRDKAAVDAFVNDPLCFPALKPDSMQSFLAASSRLANPREIRNMRDDLPIYIFSGSDDPVGQRLEGVRVLIDRYRSAGISSIAHDFYPGGRHEILHEINRRDVITNLLVWISGILDRAHSKESSFSEMRGRGNLRKS
jgi:alpha-beta hydrolase superfamily lysophospholipase